MYYWSGERCAVCCVCVPSSPVPWPHSLTRTHALSPGETSELGAWLALGDCCRKRWGCHSPSCCCFPADLSSRCCCCSASIAVVPAVSACSPFGKCFFSKWLITAVSGLAFLISSQKHCKYDFHYSSLVIAFVKLFCFALNGRSNSWEVCEACCGLCSCLRCSDVPLSF